MTDLDLINDIERIAPKPFSFSAPYWEASREKRLLVQFCLDTGQYQFPPRPVSLFTGRANLEWREVSGKGEVFAHTIARAAPSALRQAVPFAIATVTLDVGVNVIGNIVDIAPERVTVGMPVVSAWAPQTDGTHLLMFRPKP